MLAIATKGGHTLCDWNVDKDGVDVTIRSKALIVEIDLKKHSAAQQGQGRGANAALRTFPASPIVAVV
jgi:hypothetical protein